MRIPVRFLRSLSFAEGGVVRSREATDTVPVLLSGCAYPLSPVRASLNHELKRFLAEAGQAVDGFGDGEMECPCWPDCLEDRE